MALLDATLAFALTMGILGTIATVLVEALHRSIKVRRRNLVRIVARVVDTLADAPLNLTPEARLRLLRRIVENPALPGAGLKVDGDDGATPSRALGWCQLVAAVAERGRALWRLLRGAREPAPAASPGAPTVLSDELPLRRWCVLGAAVYERVSLEHVLRRIAELPEAKLLAARQPQRLERLLESVSARHGEYGAAVASRFAGNARAWSLAAGVALALLANIDGLRIFEAFESNEALTAALIARQAAAQQEGQTPSLDELSAIGIPIGWTLYPGCVQRGDGAPTARDCAGIERRVWCPGWLKADDAAGGHCGPLAASVLVTVLTDGSGEGLGWLFRVLLTGLLIGLGAPFWFDVAKRLAQVRSAFGAAGNSEKRLSGEDPGGEADARGALVRKVTGALRAEIEAGLFSPRVLLQQHLLRYLDPQGAGDVPLDGAEGSAATRAATQTLLRRLGGGDTVAGGREEQLHRLLSAAAQRALAAAGYGEAGDPAHWDETTLLSRVEAFYESVGGEFESMERLLADLGVLGAPAAATAPAAGDGSAG